MSNINLEEVVKVSIETSIHDYLSNKKEPNSEHVVLDRIFPVERRIRSIIGGLETSLGTMLWEKMAKEIAIQRGLTLLDNKAFLMPLFIPNEVSAVISSWKAKREVPRANLSLSGYIGDLKNVIDQIDTSEITYATLTKGNGVDLWISMDGIEYAFDLKTVQINAKAGLSFNTTLMEWYAYRLMRKNVIDFEARIVFPYCPFKPPTVDTWWKKVGGRAYPLQQKTDVWVQDEFWDFLTGKPSTWPRILAVMDTIGKEGFGEKYKRLFYPNSD